MSALGTASNVFGRLPRVTEPAMVSDVALKTLQEAQPLTVLRAARGFGKTAVLVHWLRNYTDAATAVYCPLDARSNTQVEFWVVLEKALRGAGTLPEGAGAEDARSRVLDGIGALRQPLRLVLDNFHEAGLTEGATQIDDDLIELVRNNDQFYLVAAGRTLRSLETMGSLSVDGSIVGPSDLRMRPEQVQQLAAMAGLEFSWERAQQVSTDFGGWPAAIRAGLRGATNEGGIDEQLIQGYIGAMVLDLRFSDIRTFLLRTAVPAWFDIDLLRVITPKTDDGASDQDAAAILAHIRNTGLLWEDRVAGAVRYGYPAAIRRALLQVMTESAPDIGRQVHRALLAAPGAEQDPGEALMHAVNAQEWATALDLIDRQWFHLLTEAPQTLVQAIHHIPMPHGQHDPWIRVARQHLAAMHERLASGHTWAVPEALLSRSDAISEAGGAADTADAESIVLVQWGVAAMLSGHHDAAIYAFGQARELGLEGGTKATTLGASGVALVHALAGEPDLARTALQDAALQSHLADSHVVDPNDLAGVAVRLAEAMIAVDAGAPDASMRVAAIVEPRHRTELWVVGEFARAHYAAFADDPEEVFRQANKLRAALRHVPRNSLADTVLQSVLVELLLIARMVGVAGEVADQLGDNAIAWAAQAKVHNARQDYRQAVQLTRRSLSVPGSSLRSQLESMVIMASALHAMNAQSEARQAFQSAVRLARATGQRRPFQLMHRYVFDMLADGMPGAHGLWPGTNPNAVKADAVDVADLPTLTMREAQILRALERHAGPVGIGRSLDLSANTVKTHLRSIYRKLGVASRNEALDVAGRGGVHTEYEG